MKNEPWSSPRWIMTSGTALGTWELQAGEASSARRTHIEGCSQTYISTHAQERERNIIDFPGCPPPRGHEWTGNQATSSCAITVQPKRLREIGSQSGYGGDVRSRSPFRFSKHTQGHTQEHRSKQVRPLIFPVLRAILSIYCLEISGNVSDFEEIGYMSSPGNLSNLQER